MEVSITGLDGLAAVRSHLPDLILLDMHLPDISGLDLLRHLKQDAHTAHVPIVVVSADALAQQIADALEAGADRYLTQAVSVTELLAVLDRAAGAIRTRIPVARKRHRASVTTRAFAKAGAVARALVQRHPCEWG
jgi:CheY-like chemotaxis protein